MVLERYNDDLTWTEEEDRMFAELAQERTARHPWRTYLAIPLGSVMAMWFTPRIELLPVSGTCSRWPTNGKRIRWTSA